MRNVVTGGLALAGLMLAGSAVWPQGFVMPSETDAMSGRIMAERQEKLKALTPVTDDLLRDPPDGEWVDWRRTYDGWGYSPLKQIDRGNVKGLQLAWSWSMASGPTNGVPLVHDGVIFIQHYGDTLEALDAATGDLLWRWQRRVPRGVAARQKRGIAIYGENVYATTSDSKLIAVNMRTGELTWEQQVGADEKNYYISGSPMVVNGKVLIGTTGCATVQTGGCFISAFDAGTGKPLWRFNTTAQGEDAAGKSWNGLPPGKRLGGAVWTAGTYDKELNLVYFGVGQPYPWNAYARGTLPPKDAPGVTNDALYTNSTLALNPDTGELVWYHQYLPNDSWDMDYSFERKIVEARVDGRMRKLVVTSGKMAIVEAVDAETGEFVFAKDLGLQTLVTAIDPKTGEKTFDPRLEPVPGKTYTFCPHAGGARSWPASAYDPRLKRLFIPLQMHCAEYEPAAKADADMMAGVRWKILPPRNADGNFGRLDALDLESQDWAWKYETRAPQSTASLPTAGGIVFEGQFDRYFTAHDSRTGKLLWQARLEDVPNSYPVTYEVDGRQYVAVMTGSGGPYTSTWQGLIPDIRLPAQSGGALYVFALPE